MLPGRKDKDNISMAEIDSLVLTEIKELLRQLKAIDALTAYLNINKRK